MSDNNATRRDFLQLLGLTAGAALTGNHAFAGLVDEAIVHKLNPVQQDFMGRYGKWMDEFIEVIHVQKSAPGNLENQQKMMVLTEQAEAFKPELDEHMKDPVFAVIYKMAIERMSAVI